MIIVTAGYEFIDIDAYGGCIAYAELLNKLGQEAQAVSNAPLNDSITATIRSWNAPLLTSYAPSDKDEFCIIDISEPAFIEKFVDQKRITRVIDHHTGFETEWAHLGDAAVIEFIGAACTLVYEQWLQTEKLPEISELSARLLICGILDNTLNFKASLTTDRDHNAYTELLKFANLPDDWPAAYFTDCQEAIEKDVVAAVKNDTKLIQEITKLPHVFGQLVLWNAREFLGNNSETVVQTLESIGQDWVLNLISIEEGRNYIFATDPEVQTKIERLMNVQFSDSVAITDRLYLRKEIIKKARE